VDRPLRPNGGATVEHAHRVTLWVGAMVVGLVAIGLPLIPAGPAVVWQILIGLVAMITLGASAWFRPGLVVTAVLVTGTAGLALLETDDPLPNVTLAGVFALGALEAMALLRQWLTVGRLDVAAEMRHVRAGAVRVAAGATVGVGSAVLGLVELPAPGIVAAAGVLATGTLIVMSAHRA